MLKAMLATRLRKASIAFRRLSSNVNVVTLCHIVLVWKLEEAVQGYWVRGRLGLGLRYLECGDVLLSYGYGWPCVIDMRRQTPQQD